MSTLIFAAANPEGEFHGVDFNPAHIALARERASAARLDNVTFHECSFEQLSRSDGPDLPMFDVVTMHGVWSWVSPDMQQAIVDFLAKRVKPGGLVHVSYNTLPYWLSISPLQRILKELAALSPGSSDMAVRNAFAMVERLGEYNILPAAMRETLKQITQGQPIEHMLTYFAHEYLNEHWKPLYHADVVRAFAQAKLNFACSADPLKSFSNLHVSERQQALLAEIPSDEVRETVVDFVTNTGLRTDVFLRGARRMTLRRRDQVLRALRLALVRVPPEAIELPGPEGTLWRADPDAYRRFMAALETRPHTVGELLSLPGLPAGHEVNPAELVGILVGTVAALPFEDASPAARDSSNRFNHLTESEGEVSVSRTVTMAIPSLRMGLSFSPIDFDVYLAIRRGERPDPRSMARRFAARCKTHGGYPVVDGKHYPNEAEAHQALTADYAKKIEQFIPLWANAGVIETSR